jgi:hypothetical protein
VATRRRTSPATLDDVVTAIDHLATLLEDVRNLLLLQQQLVQTSFQDFHRK